MAYQGKKPKRRIMRALKINEISAVDTPAQEGALSVLMKRNDGDGGSACIVEKRTALIEGIDHSHLIQLDHGNGLMSAGKTSWDNDHDHPWILKEDGELVVGSGSGPDGQAHSHTVSAVSKTDNSNQEDDMSDEKIAELEAQVEWHKKVAALSDIEKAHFNSLSDESQIEYLVKSADERLADAEKAASAEKSADPVVFKARNGDEFRASDDPRMVAMAKRTDDAEEKAEKAASALADTDLRKRAEGLKHLPGTTEEHMATLKAIDAIEDEGVRENAIKNLHAHDANLAGAFKSIGSDGEPAADGEASDQLDTLAKVYAEEHSVTPEVAMDEVLKTEQGAKLYADIG
jgi:hypothetical protein